MRPIVMRTRTRVKYTCLSPILLPPYNHIPPYTPSLPDNSARALHDDTTGGDITNKQWGIPYSIKWYRWWR